MTTDSKKTSKKTSKKVTKKTSKKTAKVAGTRGRKPSIPNEAKVKVLVKENPRRSGTAAYKRFSLYKSGMTVGEYIKAGGKRGSLLKDVRKGFVSVSAGNVPSKKDAPATPKKTAKKVTEKTSKKKEASKKTGKKTAKKAAKKTEPVVAA